MKRLLYIFAAFLIFVFLVLLAIPLIFKPRLLQTTKNTIKTQTNVQVDFSDLKLSVFKNFPQLTIELNNVLVNGQSQQKNDTLFYSPLLSSTMNLFSVFSKNNRHLSVINLNNAFLNLRVDENGRANWEITANDNSTTSEKTIEKSGDENASSFELNIDGVFMKNARLNYIDKENNTEVFLTDINFNISGKMYGEQANLTLDGGIEKFTLNYNQNQYISNVRLNTTTDLNVDYTKMLFSILNNKTTINRLPMQISGDFSMPSDSMFFNLELNTLKSGIDNFLALVPAQFDSYLSQTKSEGDARISGKIKGFYFNDNYPEINISSIISKGKIQYAELPEQIKNIKANLSVYKPQGNLNLTDIQIKNAHFDIKNNPVDMSLSVANPVSDPVFDATFIGRLNFDDLKEVMPLDSANISGLLDANLFVKAKYSDIEKADYTRVKSDGIILLDNFIYDSPALTQKVLIPEAKLVFSPQNVDLQNFNVSVAQSRIMLRGKVSNYLNYFLNEGVLKGELRLNSDFVNLNQLLRMQASSATQAPKESKTENSNSNDKTTAPDEDLTLAIPENIDVTFRADIKNALLNQLQLSNIDGLITAKNKKLSLNNLGLNVLNGELNLSGSYFNPGDNLPFFDFGFVLKNFEINELMNVLTGIQNRLQSQPQNTGVVNSQFKLNGRLSKQLKVIASSTNGGGTFTSENITIKNSPVFNQLKGILKEEKLRNVKVDDFDAHFNVKNGNLLLKPFDTKIAGQETHVAGSLNTENLLNMRLDFNIERNAFGEDIQNILSVLPGNDDIKKVPAGVILNGPVDNPDVKMDLSETRKTITEATKGNLQNSLKKLRNFFK